MVFVLVSFSKRTKMVKGVNSNNFNMIITQVILKQKMSEILKYFDGFEITVNWMSEIAYIFTS